MHTELSLLIDRLNNPTLVEASVIAWGCPVPSFGNFSSSKLATLGINPSNREFVDIDGSELVGPHRRFHTLNSLGLTKWTEVNNCHLNAIMDLCVEYFRRNPYDGWFKKLDYLISGTQMSYYFPSAQACHLDLVPYATLLKWTELTARQRSALLELTGDTLGLLLSRSSIRVLILNGETVVKHFQKVANVRLESQIMPGWTLPRKTGGVNGVAYKGEITSIGGVHLTSSIMVLGYNHNIQSSFGVTTQVQTEIRNWIALTTKEVFS